MRIAIIGSGFAGLSAATELAQRGYEVEVFEKNAQTGGRARVFREKGYTFDMGPSWYWMPDVFDEYFEHFGKKVSDYYQLIRLDPSYQIFFDGQESLNVDADLDGLKKQLDALEPGAGAALDAFLAEAQIKYDTGMKKFVWKPSLSVMEYADFNLVKESFRLQLFSNMRTHLRKFFKNPKILQLLEFPVLFLGAKPEKTPALYSMMNYADIQLGTWYPMGGMYKIVEAMTSLAREKGVKFHTSAPVDKIVVEGKRATGIQVNGQIHSFDFVIGGADYHHIESKLLDVQNRSYSEEYWNSRVMSPSCLLFYVGVKKRIQGLKHHNLFFDQSFDDHAVKIYDQPQWPDHPLFYVCCPSQTDPDVAPEGHENLFILIPVAPGLTSDEETRQPYLEDCIRRIEQKTGVSFEQDIDYVRSYAHEEFIEDYNSFKGNAYGLANTLMQTAFMKPRMKSKKVDRLYYTGQLTVPGPGVPPSLISGRVVAQEIDRVVKSTSLKSKNAFINHE